MARRSHTMEDGRAPMRSARVSSLRRSTCAQTVEASALAAPSYRCRALGSREPASTHSCGCSLLRRRGMRVGAAFSTAVGSSISPPPP